MKFDHRDEVLVAARDIAIGQQLTAADLSVARVASDSVPMLAADQESQVIGQYAVQDVAKGRLMDGRMLSKSGLMSADSAAVGVALKAGRFPASGLTSGDVVQVVQANNGTGTVLVDKATVGSVQSSADSSSSDSSSGGLTATLIIPRTAAPTVGAAAADDQIVIVLLARGQTAGSGNG